MKRHVAENRKWRRRRTKINHERNDNEEKKSEENERSNENTAVDIGRTWGLWAGIAGGRAAGW